MESSSLATSWINFAPLFAVVLVLTNSRAARTPTLIDLFERGDDGIVLKPLPAYRARGPKELVVALALRKWTLALTPSLLSLCERVEEAAWRVRELDLAGRSLLLPSVAFTGRMEARVDEGVATCRFPIEARAKTVASTEPFDVGKKIVPASASGQRARSFRQTIPVHQRIAIWVLSFTPLEANRNLLTAMRLLPKSIHWCRRYPTKFNSGRDIPH